MKMRKHGSSSKGHPLAHIKVLVKLTSETVIDMGVVCQVLVSSGDFPGGSVGKNLPARAGDVSSIPGLGRSLGGGNGNALQYSCLGNPMDRGAWQATVHPWGH